MSDYELKRINALTEASAIGDDDVFAIDSVNGTKKVKWSTIDGKVGDKVDGMLAVATVPNAEQLIAHTGITDTEPYFSRPSASIGDREFDTLVGGTFGWNQLVQNGNFADTSGWAVTSATTFSVANNEGVIQFPESGIGSVYQAVPFVTGHKYLYGASVKGDAAYSGIYATLGSGEFLAYDLTTSYKRFEIVFNYSASSTNLNVARKNSSTGEKIYVKDAQCIDLTILFGSTIADYIYSLEQATTGAGVAWVRRYLTADYYAYCAPTLKHVSGVSAHVMRDANNNVIGNYPIDSTWVGMGVPKLDSANKLYFDGDRYASDGTVTVKYAIRAYESGDTSDGSTMITDGTNTVYKLTTSTTDSATPYTSPQIVDKDGTEEYVTTGLVPVGHETLYPIDIRGTIETISETPTEDGTYTLKCTVAGGVPTMEWVSE